MTEIGMLSKNKIKNVNTGWDWNPSNIYIIYATGDGACFYHSISECLFYVYKHTEYVCDYAKSDNITESRELYVTNLKKSLLKELFSKTDISEKEAFSNIKNRNIEQIFEKYVRDPINKNYLPINISWHVYLFDQIFIEKNINVCKEISDKCVYINNSKGNEGLIEDLTSEKVEEILSELKMPEIEIDSTLLAYIYKNIDKSFKNVNFSMFPPKDIKQYEQAFSNIKNMVISLKYMFYDKHNFEYKKYKNVQFKKSIIPLSIYTKTNKIFTNEDIEEVFNIDPRIDFDIKEDSILWKLPLNLFYFELFDYKMLDKYANYSFNGKNNFDPKVLNKNINKYSCWAIYEVISLIPQILGVNIYIVKCFKDGIKLYDYFPALNSNINIVLRVYENVHFEPMGIKNNDNIQMVFDNDHPFVVNLQKLKNV